MRSDFHWTAILERSLSGLFLGGLSGAFSAGLIGTAIGAVVEAAKPAMDGMASPWVMIVCAIVALPGAAVGGACAALWRRRFIGSIAGVAGSLLAISYPVYSLYRYDDYSVPYSIILMGVAPIVGAVLAGVLVGSLANRDIPDWERIE